MHLFPTLYDRIKFLIKISYCVGLFYKTNYLIELTHNILPKYHLENNVPQALCKHRHKRRKCNNAMAQGILFQIIDFSMVAEVLSLSTCSDAGEF